MTRATKCVSGGVAGQQKPCGFVAALGRRQRVAHNSTGPTSVALILGFRRGAGAAGGSIESTGATPGEATLDVSGTLNGKAIRFSLCLSRSKSRPVRHLAPLRDALLLRPADNRRL